MKSAEREETGPPRTVEGRPSTPTKNVNRVVNFMPAPKSRQLLVSPPRHREDHIIVEQPTSDYDLGYTSSRSVRVVEIVVLCTSLPQFPRGR